MGQILVFALIGAVSGLVMGTVGVGGGAIVITSLLYVAHFSQKVAQGTTLFVVAAPVSLLAAYAYYRHGYVDIRAGVTIMLAFLLFSYLGAQLAAGLPRETLRVGLGVVLVLMGLRMIFA